MNRKLTVILINLGMHSIWEDHEFCNCILDQCVLQSEIPEFEISMDGFDAVKQAEFEIKSYDGLYDCNISFIVIEDWKEELDAVVKEAIGRAQQEMRMVNIYADVKMKERTAKYCEEFVTKDSHLFFF